MKHYFVAKTEKRLGEMIQQFLFTYNIAKINKIDDMGQQDEDEDFCYKICIDFEDYFGEFDPRSDGMIHYDNEAEDAIKEACSRYLKKNPPQHEVMVSTPYKTNQQKREELMDKAHVLKIMKDINILTQDELTIFYANIREELGLPLRDFNKEYDGDGKE